jgi:hypothetical protein
LSDKPDVYKKPFIERLKDNFRPTQISNADETLFDVCMKCGVRLPDKKLSTLREHQKKEHPLTAKEKRSAFMFKHMLPVVFSIMITVIIVTMVIPDYGIDPVGTIMTGMGLIDEEQTTINVETCTVKTIELKARLYEQQKFLSSDAEDFNYLLENCNASFWSYKYGETLFETDYYSKTNIEERGDLKFIGGK